ncbi:hypothetical protein AXF42_Ash010748 [Apostasia shenzhenica]|uniref:Uncharacterized protein n=1 Tax=Apostasia shenzhenica TaxID=1088818 RepID=A0A2I0A0L8_9ASPA|nr:hypothetical protein AXF42_Ash010748 [Apostasia shenzhenica]
MLANLTNLVTGLTAQKAVILRQTQAACVAVLPLLSVAAVPLLPVAVASTPFPPIAAAPRLSPPVAATSALFQPFATGAPLRLREQRGAPLTSRAPGSFHPPSQDFPHQGTPQYGPEAFFGSLDFDAAFSDAF